MQRSIPSAANTSSKLGTIEGRYASLGLDVCLHDCVGDQQGDVIPLERQTLSADCHRKTTLE